MRLAELVTLLKMCLRVHVRHALRRLMRLTDRYVVVVIARRICDGRQRRDGTVPKVTVPLLFPADQVPQLERVITAHHQCVAVTLRPRVVR